MEGIGWDKQWLDPSSECGETECEEEEGSFGLGGERGETEEDEECRKGKGRC